MNVKMENLEKNVVKFEVVVEAEKFNEAVKKSFKKNASKFNIPGFRKGKAPMNLIKKFYGEAVLYEDAINFVCDDTYPEIIKEHEINAIDYPKIDIVQIGEGKDFIYTAEVTTMPEVELGEYKGVEVKKNTYEVTEEDVENKIKEMQKQNARIEAKEEGTLETGNIAVIDFKGFVDDKAFEGGEGKDYELEIGSGTFIDNFEEQLVGMSIGESKDVNVKFPEEYGREELNGKAAKFEVTLKGMKSKELPAIDDEFASEVSEFETLEELRNDTKKKMVEANELRSNNEFENAVLEKVVANATVEIPAVMTEREIDTMLRDLEMRLKYQGLDLETYYKLTGSTEEKFREQMQEVAETKVKSTLVIGKIADVEEFKATDDEVKAKAMEIAKQYYSGEELEKNAENFAKAQREYLEADIISNKVKELLIGGAKVTA